MKSVTLSYFFLVLRTVGGIEDAPKILLNNIRTLMASKEIRQERTMCQSSSVSQKIPGEGFFLLQGGTQKYISRADKSTRKYSVIIYTPCLKVIMIVYKFRRDIFKPSILFNCGEKMKIWPKCSLSLKKAKWSLECIVWKGFACIVKDREKICEVCEDCVLFLYIMPSPSKAPGSKDERWKGLRNFVKCFSIYITEVKSSHSQQLTATMENAPSEVPRRQVTSHNAVTSHPFD